MASLFHPGELAAMVDTLQELSNARLTEIKPAGATDSRGRTLPAAAVWTGSAPGFLQRESMQALRSGVQVTEHVDTFTILDDSGAPILEAAGPSWSGSYVTIEDRRTDPSTTQTYRVRDMVHRASGLLDDVKLELETTA